MKWTSEPPTNPGFYWCKIKDEIQDGISPVEISEWYAEELDKNLLILELIGDEEKYILNEKITSVTLWAGPIPEPEE